MTLLVCECDHAHALCTPDCHGRLVVARAQEWFDVMMDALRASDNGNNPFYSDDDDTVSLAQELAEAVIAHLDDKAIS